MNLSRTLICCVALLGFVYDSAKAQVTPTRRAEAEQAIRELENDVSKAIAAKDLDALFSLYAENAALYNDKGPMIRGKKAIREAWGADFTRHGLTMSTEPRTVEISNTGNLAWAHGIFRIAVGSPDTRAGDEWEYALIYTKQSDGKWKIMADSAHALLQHRVQPAKAQRGWMDAIGGIFWWSTYLISLVFLLALPFMAIVSIWNSWRARKITAGFLMFIVMLLAFSVGAVLFWNLLGAPYWNLPLNDAFAAAGDTARYGNPVEDTAEDLLVPILIFSVFSALIAGAVSGFMRRAWIRHHSLA